MLWPWPGAAGPCEPAPSVIVGPVAGLAPEGAAPGEEGAADRSAAPCVLWTIVPAEVVLPDPRQREGSPP